MKIFDIATLGSSLTAGSGTEFGYHRDLTLALQPGKSEYVRTYNFGIPGGDTLDGIDVAGSVAALRPRVILIEFMVNDCGTFSQAVSRGYTISLLNALKTAAPASAIYLMTMNPMETSKPGGASRAALPAYSQIYRDLAVSESVGIIDCLASWGTANLTDIPDGVHPTWTANRAKLVPTIAAALSGLIS